MSDENKKELEETRLWKEYRRTLDQNIKDKLILQYAPLVKYVAGRLFETPPKHIYFEELIGAGTLGLVDAVEKFELDKNVQFKTYAITRIQGAIQDELRKLDPLSRTVRKQFKDIERVKSDLHDKLERDPTMDEILESTGLTKKQYTEAIAAVGKSYITSLDSVVYTNGDGEEITFSDQIGTPSDDSPEQVAAYQDLVRVLKHTLKELPTREFRVLILYHYEELTLKEIGKVLDVTESRVSQLHARALSKVKAKLFSHRKGVFEK